MAPDFRDEEYIFSVKSSLFGKNMRASFLASPQLNRIEEEEERP